MSGHVPSGFFVLRTPRLPLAPIAELRGRVGDPDVRDALAAASPGLAAAAAGGTRDPALELSVTRYLARMSGRATPRGMLAGVSTGRLASPARLRIGRPRPISRLGATAVAAIARRLEADPDVRARITYRPNPWMYDTGPARLRYVEPRAASGHSLVAAEASPELRSVLARARAGATLPQLADSLVLEGADTAEARSFVEELADAHLLASELAIPACGADPQRHLLERMHELAPGSPQLRDLEALLAVLAAADRAAPGERSRTLGRGRAPAERLGLPGAPEEHLQVDLLRDAPGLTLPPSIAADLLAGLETLRRIVRGQEPEDLTRFREAFRARYGERRVPLCEALDPETGIGFGAEASTPSANPPGVPWGPPEQLMLRLLADAAGGGLREVDIGSALPSLAGRPAARLPDSLAVMATISAQSDDAVTAGDYEVRLVGAFGPSGARLFGRFCHHDDELRRHAEQHLRAEEALHPDAVFAELSHLPDASVGDVVSRPALRHHEIALLTGADAQVEGRIEPRELDLGLEGDALVLRAPSGSRVMPRLTNAHHVFGDGLGLYRFLALLQFQGLAPGLSWSWGPLEGAPFLPRVRVGRVVLSLARWRIAPGELRSLREGGHEQRAAAVAAWRRRVGCPRFVGLPVQESALPLDLDDPACAEILLRDAPPAGHAVVQEWWPAPDDSPVLGEGGRYGHELLVPFVAQREPTRDGVRPRAAETVRRARPPGSDWLFAKLYTAPSLADELIVDELAPLARAAVSAGAATSWHFLRYADPEFHLRLRLQGDPESLRRDLLPEVLAAADRLMVAGTLRRVVLDTYEREVERYGGSQGILLAEGVFHADSDAVASLLSRVPLGEEAARDRWHLAAAGVWSLLLALGLADDDAAALVGRLRDGLGAEQGLDHAGVRALARRLRRARPAIEMLMDDPPDALRQRDAALAPTAALLQQADAGGTLCRSRSRIAADLAHMHCNRLLRGSPRPQELMIHDALGRILAGRAARSRRTAAAR